MALPVSLFDYDLPASLIAQTPALRRDQSRLLVVDRARKSVGHHVFADLPNFVSANDLIVRNNVSVIPARLRAHRPTGGAVECLLLRPETAHDGIEPWWCLLRPGKRLPVGSTFGVSEAFSATVAEKREEGAALVEFRSAGGAPMVSVAQRLGEVPLPPYIERKAEDNRRAEDLVRYQTVYADPQKTRAVAAPTAGLHFTPALLTQLATVGVSFADVTLHVGLGTFKPISTDFVEDHPIHRETYEVPLKTQLALSSQKRRIAVGTTTVRSVEDYLSRNVSPSSEAWIAESALFIYPPRAFRGVDALITNFHQPRSTLLCLVAAFLTPGSMDGVSWLREIYAEAIAHQYRFFSYGDAMLIL